TDVVVPSPVTIQFNAPGGQKQYELFPADNQNNPIFNKDIRIQAGTNTNTSIIGIEGQTFTQSATASGGPNQFVQLDNSPVLWDSVQVSVDGVPWTQVDYFSDSQPRREFRVEFSSTYQAFVMFGNEQAGLMPNSGSQIQVIYRAGGGTDGNVVTGALTASVNGSQDGVPGVIVVNFQNYTRGIGGYEGDALADIQRKLPSYLRAQNRAVTGLDYKTLADQFTTPYSGQIGKSTAVLRNHG